MLIATDLDRTLIYSAAAAAAAAGPSGPTGVIGPTGVTAVERFEGRDISFMSTGAAAAFARLARATPVVPVTTRTPEQYARIRLPGPPPPYVVCANGGVLLVHGRADDSWTDVVRRRLAQVAPLGQVSAHVAALCRPEWTSSIRQASGLFCYAVVDRSQLPADVVATSRSWAAERGWQVSVQGRKIYWVPEPLRKSAALAQLRLRLPIGRVLAAGDSLLDADLLLAADAGIVARHGELVASGWRAPHIDVTSADGLAAGAQIVDWFTRHAERDGAPVAVPAQLP